MTTLTQEYKEKVVPALMERFSYKNVLSVPRLKKIIVSMRISSSEDKKEALEHATDIIATVTGQRPTRTLARKSVSGFKIRQGELAGSMVTLRGTRMYEFLERLINVAVPRIRDFRGLNPKAFDGRGNYNMGLDESLIFPEVNPDETSGARGMNITIVSSARNDEEAAELLRLLGMPFTNNSGGRA
jgi:large subunit ribosomal protein L5